MKLEKKISRMLKQLREARGWSLDAASKKTQVSKSMLGQIERGESSPTIATLWKIASGFDVSFSSFIEDSKKTNRKADMKQIHPNDDLIRVMTLFPFDKALKFEIFVIELLPGCEHVSPPHQKGVVEHVVVSQGEIEVLIIDKWNKLNLNEGLRFEANQVHGYRNKTAKPAIFYDIIHYTNV